MAGLHMGNADQGGCTMQKRPNILIFNPDSWRGDVLGHLGHPAAITPNVDRLVEEDAVSFRNAFCQNPVCTPSRCSFMSGWYPHVRGHRTMSYMMRDGEPVLLKLLKDNGYFVWWGGKNDLVPAQHGYDAYCDVKYEDDRPERWLWKMDRQEEWAGDRTQCSFFVGELETDDETGVYFDREWKWVEGAVDFIKTYSGDKPFCMFQALVYPHPPYAVEEPYFSAIDRSKVPPRIPTPEGWEGKPSILESLSDGLNLRTWSEEQWTELRAVYYGMCMRLDHQFGMLIDALKQTGLYDDTAIFFFTDHGDFTGDYGLVEKTENTFEDCQVRSPLVVKPPKGVPVKPGVSDALVELVDFPATVFDLAGIEPGYTHFGRSLMPLVRGETKEHRDAVFCEGGRLKGEEHCMGRPSPDSLNKPGSLMWLYAPRHKAQRSHKAHTKAAMCRTREFKYVRRLYERDELYDLRSDPMELRNRIDDPGCRGVLAELRDRLLTFLLETGDVVPLDRDKR